MSPSKQYQEMKEIFLKKCRAENSKEDFESARANDSIVIVRELFDYIEKSKDFAKFHRELQTTIYEDNISVVRYLSWVMDSDLREKGEFSGKQKNSKGLGWGAGCETPQTRREEH